MKDEKLKKMLEDHAAWLEYNLNGQGQHGALVLDENDVTPNKDNKKGRRANFSNERWCGVDLPGANLQKAFLSVDYELKSEEQGYDPYGENLYYYYEATRAELQGANFSEANLQDADLRGADLSGADLSEADLRGADLSNSAPIQQNDDYVVGEYNPDYDSYETNLLGADLSNADLRGANLYGANLSRADLSNANLRGANLQKANLTDAILKGANFSGADLTDADLTGADLTDANLRGAKGYKPSYA